MRRALCDVAQSGDLLLLYGRSEGEHEQLQSMSGDPAGVSGCQVGTGRGGEE